MLRFTLHRPSQNSQVSTCCHGMSCRDISGRVHIGVRLVPASHAHEGRLVLATLRSDVLAGVTGLRRVRSFDFLDPAGCFLLQTSNEHAPSGFEDAPVEPRLLGDVPARVLDGPSCGSGHTFDVEVLDPDHVEALGKACGGLLNPVLTPVNLLPSPDRSGSALSGAGSTRAGHRQAFVAAAGDAQPPSRPTRQDWSSHRWTARPRQ